MNQAIRLSDFMVERKVTVLSATGGEGNSLSLCYQVASEMVESRRFTGSHAAYDRQIESFERNKLSINKLSVKYPHSLVEFTLNYFDRCIRIFGERGTAAYYSQVWEGDLLGWQFLA